MDTRPHRLCSPLLLLGLIALPILWLLLRAVPPAPIKRRFPGVALLLGLTTQKANQTARLGGSLLLRLLAVAALIVGFAGPVLNPQTAEDGSGDLVIALDGSWAGAPGWAARMDRVDGFLDRSRTRLTDAAIVNLADLPQATSPLQHPASGATNLPTCNRSLGNQPSEHPTGLPRNQAAFRNLLDVRRYRLGRAQRSSGRLEAHGPVTVFQSPRPTFGLRPPAMKTVKSSSLPSARPSATPTLHLDRHRP